MMREVWRIENEDGFGPYANFDNTGLCFEGAMRELSVDHDLSYRHPIARANMIANSKYGFSSREQLERWFDYFGQHGYDLLLKHGFRITVYEVSHLYVEEHDRQVIYDADESHYVREEEFTQCTTTTSVG